MKLLMLSAALWFSITSGMPVLAQAAFTQSEIDAAPKCGKGRDLKDGVTELCQCKERGFDFFIWGTGPYAAHSDVCTAARHAGVITKADGGVIVAIGRPGQESYAEGLANDVQGRKWGRSSSSFDVALASTFGGAAEVAAMPLCQAFAPSAAPYDCACAESGGKNRSVWGSGPYTGDSDVCSAARHAGAVDDSGGPVRVTAAPGQSAYQGSEANGVSTSNWGAYGDSFQIEPLRARADGAACSFLPAEADAHECVCAPAKGADGSVWGSGPYTADSHICTAARHAGVISNQGGAVNVLRVRGLPGYSGSEANGVTTTDWGRFETSLVFNGN